MEQNNINKLSNNIYGQYYLDNSTANLNKYFNELPIVKSNNININYNNQKIVKDVLPIDQKVEYKPADNFLERNLQYIARTEQDRIQKSNQRQILMNLMKEKISTLNGAKSYARTMDESVTVNANKKEVKKNVEEDIKETFLHQEREVMQDAREVQKVSQSSEEFNEEFVKEDKTDYREDESNNNKQNEEGENNNKKIFQLEDDEYVELSEFERNNSIISTGNQKARNLYVLQDAQVENSEIESNIRKIASVIDRKYVNSNLELEIERRIQQIGKLIDRKFDPMKPIHIPASKNIQRLRSKYSK